MQVNNNLFFDGNCEQAIFEEAFWGAIFGGCIDQFGHYWMVHYNLS